MAQIVDWNEKNENYYKFVNMKAMALQRPFNLDLKKLLKNLWLP